MTYPSKYEKKYMKFKREVLKPHFADRQFCCKCGVNYPLQFDHIIPRSKAKDKIFDVDNIQLLCFNCHTLKTRIERRDWFDNNSFLNGEYD